MKLHELHRRRLESTVQLIESALARIEGALRDGGGTGIVHSIENPLSESERDGVLDHIRRLRTVLSAFARAFGLGQRSVDVRQIIAAELFSIWVMLENPEPSPCTMVLQKP